VARSHRAKGTMTESGLRLWLFPLINLHQRIRPAPDRSRMIETVARSDKIVGRNNVDGGGGAILHATDHEAVASSFNLVVEQLDLDPGPRRDLARAQGSHVARGPE